MTTVATLKLVCKKLNIKKYNKLRKNELDNTINRYLSILKLQRWIRKILSRGENCPISLEPIKYPCFAFKTNKTLIYYNLNIIKNYILESGNFSDPISRTKYTEANLSSMDNIDKYYKQLTKYTGVYTSVLKASKNIKFYERKKYNENELLLFERIIDEICNDLIELLNSDIIAFSTLLNIYINDYWRYFKLLVYRNKEHAEYVINKSINVFIKLETYNMYYINYILDNLYNIKTILD